MVQSGTRSPCTTLRELIDEPAIDAASAALVGVRRVGEAIAQHPFAARQRRADEVVDVHLARAEHEQRFGRRADVFLAAIEHQRADALGDLRAARLARRVDRDATRAQRLRDAVRDGGLACAFDAFERDETGGRHLAIFLSGARDSVARRHCALRAWRRTHAIRRPRRSRRRRYRRFRVAGSPPRWLRAMATQSASAAIPRVCRCCTACRCAGRVRGCCRRSERPCRRSRSGRSAAACFGAGA